MPSANEPEQTAGPAWRGWILPGLLLLALVLRLIHLGSRAELPDFREPLRDAAYHQYWAAAAATGDWTPPAGTPDPEIGAHPYLKPPGYPWFLSTVYRVLGTGPWAGRAAQILLGLLNVLLLYRVGTRFGGTAVGWFAAGFAAISWQMVFYEQELMEPVLLIALLLGFFDLASRWPERATPARAAGAGALIGLGLLVRPNLALFLPVAAWWMYRHAPSAAPRRKALPWVFAAAALAVTLPATLRNLAVSGEPVWISANGGINLYFGNNPSANGLDPVSDDIPAWNPFGYANLVEQLSAAEGRDLGYREASSVFAARARAFWREQPGRALALTLAKARYFWAANEIGNESAIREIRQASPLLRNLPFPFAFLLAAALTGLVMTWRSPRTDRGTGTLLLGFVVVYALSFLPFFAAARFRIPVLPVLFVFAAAAVVDIDRRYQAGGFRGAGAWVAGLAGLWLLLSLNVSPGAARPGQVLVDRGISLARAGDWDGAEALFAEAVERDPADYIALYQLGNVQLREGRLAEAMTSFERSASIQPAYHSARLGMGKVHAQRRAFDEASAVFESVLEDAPALAEGWLLLAATRQAQNRLQEAMWSYQKAHELVPEAPEPMVGLGYVFLAMGQPAEADTWFTNALKVQPGLPEAAEGLRAVEAVRSRGR